MQTPALFFLASAILFASEHPLVDAAKHQDASRAAALLARHADPNEKQGDEPRRCTGPRTGTICISPALCSPPERGPRPPMMMV